MVEKFDPNLILVNITKLKLYRTPIVISQGQEATTKGGGEDLMAIPHQNSIVEYKSNGQHRINTIEGFHGMIVESPYRNPTFGKV